MAAEGCVEWLEAKPGRVIGQVVLAAADIDADYFMQALAPPLTAGAERITVYVAADDKALAVAGQLHNGTRIGATVVEIPGVDTVEVSLTNEDLMQHSYYATSSFMLRDLALVLQGTTASERSLVRVGGHDMLK